MAFLTEAEWNTGEKYNGLTTILKWGEVPEKKIFSVILIKKKENSRYDQHIHFMDTQEEGYQALCPSHFVKQRCKNRGRNQRPYFISHSRIQHGDTTMASFELYYTTMALFELYKTEDKSFDIFE